jgi:hypothetical protein
VGYILIIQYMYVRCHNQIRIINISISSTMSHLYMMGTLYSLVIFEISCFNQQSPCCAKQAADVIPLLSMCLGPLVELCSAPLRSPFPVLKDHCSIPFFYELMYWLAQISENVWNLSFCVYLVSLHTITSSSIHAATNDRILFFLRLNSIPLYKYAIFSLAIL